jgi:hypothetical protein
MNATAQDEINAYVEGVRQALAGIDEATREELLEDLPEHLAEVRAEGTGTLIERLGTPEAYASELRATAGLVGGFPDPPPPRFAALATLRGQIEDSLRTVDVRVGPVIGYPKASDFLVLLRPAWWVLRGYLAAMAIAYLLDGNHGQIGLLPRLGGSGLVALVLLGGSIVVSIVLGNRAATLSRWPRYALRAGTVFLVFFALSGFVGADSDTRDPGYSDANYGYSDPNPYSNINDVYVYDSQGKLVTGARLYDQDGSPIQIGNNYCEDTETGATERSRAMGYPYCPENAPFIPFPSGSASPSGSLSPSSSASPSGSGSSSRSLSPSSSVSSSGSPSPSR